MFYAGKSFSAIPAKRSTKLVQKDDKILKSLCGTNKPQSLFQSRLVPLAQPSRNSLKPATQIQSDAERLKSLEQNNESKSPPEEKQAPNIK